MRHATISVWAAVGLLAVVAGCASNELPATSTGSPSLGAASMQGAPVQEQDYGWAVLVETDRQLERLAAARDGTDDPFYKADVDGRIATLAATSDALLAEMTAADGRIHDARIRQLRWELQRQLTDAEAAELER
jgi:hypothetical protein